MPFTLCFSCPISVLPAPQMLLLPGEGKLEFVLYHMSVITVRGILSPIAKAICLVPKPEEQRNAAEWIGIPRYPFVLGLWVLTVIPGLTCRLKRTKSAEGTAKYHLERSKLCCVLNTGWPYRGKIQCWINQSKAALQDSCEQGEHHSCQGSLDPSA